MKATLSKREVKLLEITMRDVLDGLEDAASYVGYLSVPDTLEILSIEPPGRPLNPQTTPVMLNKIDKVADIVEYLVTRELKMTG
jgi:hypothetical protein